MKLIQILLSGLLELARRFKNPLLWKLSQRITVLTGLKRLAPTETLSYIRHRLDIAGYEGPEIFASSAIHLIARRSQGIPRNINRICFRSEERRVGKESGMGGARCRGSR